MEAQDSGILISVGMDRSFIYISVRNEWERVTSCDAYVASGQQPSTATDCVEMFFIPLCPQREKSQAHSRITDKIFIHLLVKQM